MVVLALCWVLSYDANFFIPLSNFFFSHILVLNVVSLTPLPVILVYNVISHCLSEVRVQLQLMIHVSTLRGLIIKHNLSALNVKGTVGGNGGIHYIQGSDSGLKHTLSHTSGC